MNASGLSTAPIAAAPTSFGRLPLSAQKGARSAGLQLSSEGFNDFEKQLNDLQSEKAPDQMALLTASLNGLAQVPVSVSAKPQVPSSPSEVSLEINSDPSQQQSGQKMQAVSWTGASVGSASAVKQSYSGTREQVMAQFLGQLQADYGIQPSQVLESFRVMTPEELSLPADKTARIFASGLGARPEQVPGIESLYLEMVDATGDSLLGQEVAGDSATGPAATQFDIVSVKDLENRKLKQSLIEMSDRFFQVKSESAHPSNSPAATAAPVLGAATVLASPHKSGSLKASQQNVSMGASSTAAQVEGGQAISSISSNSSVNPFQLIQSAMQDALNATENETLNMPENEAEAQLVGESELAGQMESAVGIGTEQSAMASLVDTKPQVSHAAVDRSVGFEAALAGASANVMSQGEPESTQNARDLVAQARVLAQAGGGEVKMALKPEGLGEVTLKVRVVDGQVSVQMTANSDHAKRAIESGLDDLRTGLASQHLQIEALKVDSAKDLQNSQMDMNSNREEARQMAQDFMSSFRQDREGFRQGLFDGGMGFRGYRQNSDEGRRIPKFDSVEQSGTVQSRAQGGRTDSTRRLDLVA